MVNEAIARLEAKLRGGLEVYREHYHDGGLIPQLSDWYPIGHKGTCERTDGRLVVGGKPATSPHTPEGREWWCEALKLNVTVIRDSEWLVQYWPARLNRLDMMHLSYQQHVADSRTEAIIAAIEAAALAAQDK